MKSNTQRSFPYYAKEHGVRAFVSRDKLFDTGSSFTQSKNWIKNGIANLYIISYINTMQNEPRFSDYHL